MRVIYRIEEALHTKVDILTTGSQEDDFLVKYKKKRCFCMVDKSIVLELLNNLMLKPRRVNKKT